jgi:hypothetical protein
LFVELLLSEATALLALFELGMAAVNLSKIYSLILKPGHLALASIRSLFVSLEGQMASPVAWAQVLRVRSRVSRIPGAWWASLF